MATPCASTSAKDSAIARKTVIGIFRRIGFVAELLDSQWRDRAGFGPFRPIGRCANEMRLRIGNFLEVYVEAPLEVCQQRDINGIYRRALSGEIQHVTGMDDPYEPPLSPDVICHTARETRDESVAKVMDRVES